MPYLHGILIALNCCGSLKCDLSYLTAMVTITIII